MEHTYFVFKKYICHAQSRDVMSKFIFCIFKSEIIYFCLLDNYFLQFTYPPASDSLYSLIYLTIERSPRFCFMSKTPFPFSPLGKIFHPPIGRPYVKAYPLNTFALSNGFCFRIALRLRWVHMLCRIIDVLQEVSNNCKWR